MIAQRGSVISMSMISLTVMLCTARPALGQATPEEMQLARRAENQRIAVIEQAQRAFTSIFSADGKGGGSGVVISPDGLALTNFHVVKPCGTYMHCAMPDGRLYDAVLVGIDPTGDVAMIKLLGRDDFPVADLGDSDQVQSGDECFVVGNPFLLATDFQPTVTWGIVSGVHRYQYPAGTLLEYADCIQTDAAINPGNSGGPLFNNRGELIGINGRGSFEKRGRVNVGVGYAISINQIKLFHAHLASGRIVDHATLGATVSTDNRGRVVVDNILESSDAFRRGLRYDDEILALGGRSIRTVNELKNVLGIYPKGWRIPLEFRRDEQDYSVFVRLAGVHSPQQLIDLVEGREGDFQPVPPKPERPDPGNPIPKKPGVPIPKIKDPRKPKFEIPDVAKKFIEEKPGYANFYFNRIRMEQIWNAFSSQGITPSVNEKWNLKATLADGVSATLILSELGSGMRWADEASVLDLNTDLSLQLVPAGSGGLLPALHLWHRMLTKGPSDYGEVYYLGRLPYANSQSTADVLVAVFDVTKSYFYFDPDDSQLIGMDLHSDENRDPCELRFDEYRQIEGRLLPTVISATSGNHFKWVLQIEEVTITP